MTDPKKPRGIICDRCGGETWKLVKVRRLVNGTVSRRRVCLGCGNRVTTEERPTRRVT